MVGCGYQDGRGKGRNRAEFPGRPGTEYTSDAVRASKRTLPRRLEGADESNGLTLLEAW